MTKPFLPSDLTPADRLQPWRRAMTAKAVAEAMGPGHFADGVIERLWGNEPRAVEGIRKAAVSPTSTTSAGTALVGTAVGQFLRSLRGISGASLLFTDPLQMAGRTSMTLPAVATAWADPAFIAEGAPFPILQGNFTGVTLGPLSKLAAGTVCTAELARYSAEDAESVVTALMNDAFARALDSAVFSATAASGVRPAGLLAGVTALTETSGGGSAALAGDIKQLFGAIHAAGGGNEIWLFAAPEQAAAAAVYAGGNVPINPVAALPEGTVVAVEKRAIASAFAGLPEVDTSREAAIHMEDATPLALGTAGTPATVAAPVRSLWQTDAVAIRMIQRCTWAPRAPGMVQFIEDATW